jgi:hypothetical protein
MSKPSKGCKQFIPNQKIGPEVTRTKVVNARRVIMTLAEIMTQVMRTGYCDHEKTLTESFNSPWNPLTS